MASHRLSSVMLATAALLGSATLAFAQSASVQPGGQTAAAKPKVNFSSETFSTGQPASPDKTQFTGDTTRNVMQWEGAGRWGLKVQLDQSVARDVQPRDMEAGAFYKVTPKLRVGVAGGLTDKATPVRKPSKDDVTPKVKLETTLKF